MEPHHTPIIFDWKPIAEKQEPVSTISAVLPVVGVRGKSFTHEAEKIFRQKITGG